MNSGIAESIIRKTVWWETNIPYLKDDFVLAIGIKEEVSLKSHFQKKNSKFLWKPADKCFCVNKLKKNTISGQASLYH